MNNSCSQNVPPTKFARQDTGSPSSELLELETTLSLCKYNCVVLELERSMLKIFGNLEQKFLLIKLRSFLKIQETTSPAIDLAKVHTSKTLAERFLKIFNCKLVNHKANAFALLQQRAAQNRKLRKYDLAEIDFNESLDDDMAGKIKELDRLTNKYHRLIAQFSLLSTKVDKSKQ